MRRRERFAVLLAGALACGVCGAAQAKEKHAGDAGPDASALTASRLPPVSDDQALPAGHPAVDDSQELPEGHPAVDDSQQGQALPEGHPAVDDSNPHASAGKGKAMPGVFQPPEDLEKEDPSLAPGSIAVEIRDADDHPLAGEMVTLGALINSIAKGDSRKHFQATTDASGVAVFSGLDTASNVAYRVSSGYQGGAFAASPFQLGQAKSMRVVLHVYPVTRDIGSALIVCETAVAAELRDDRIQIEEALTIYNLGRTAWQPDDVRMAMPDGYTAFNAQATMSDQGVDEIDGMAKLRGTFPPGRHAIEFRWQLPWANDKDVDFDVGLPPHVAIARVMMPANSAVKLMATDFPPPEVRHDEQGQSFLVTERRLRPDDARLSKLSIGIHDLPTSGPGKIIATLLAACSVGGGLLMAAMYRRTGKGRGGDVKRARDLLLDELVGLERAHTSGQVGPKTYERARRELLEALAHTLVEPV